MDKRQVEQEQASLIERICRSAELKTSEQAQRVLRAIFDLETARCGVNQEILSFKVFGWNEGAAENIGTACSDLRRRLGKYIESEAGKQEKWRCRLPAGSKNAGYHLEFFPNPEFPPTAAESFWRSHMDQDQQVSIIYDAPIFFVDWKQHFAFRYFDLNADSEAKPLEQLKRDHADVYKEGLVVERFYLSLGEVEARDRIAEWFVRCSDVIVDTRIGARVDQNDLGGFSPVLLGSTYRNPLITRVMERRSSRHLGFDYRIGIDRDRTIGRARIRDVTQDEISRLPEESIEMQGRDCIVLDNKVEGVVFGVVTRVPNPFGKGPVTIINSDFARAIHALAKAVTDEDACSELVRKVLDPSSGQPAFSFEALFRVDLGESKAAPGRAELIACRTPTES